MVKFKITSKRLAFTMIELVFAIVIIAISVLSLPMITQATQRGIENNIVQEAIFAASSELMGATSGYWDENSMQDANLSDYSRVINNISGGLKDCNNTTKLRPGHINQPFHRRCLDNNTTGVVNGAGGNFFDLNDATHVSQNIFTDPINDEKGYKETYKSTISIINNVNTKTITATITDSATPPNTLVVLRTISANIGEADFYPRTLP